MRIVDAACAVLLLALAVAIGILMSPPLARRFDMEPDLNTPFTAAIFLVIAMGGARLLTYALGWA